MTPPRFQQQRRPGWRKPEGGVCCTRPWSRYANPFAVGEPGPDGDPVPDRMAAVALWREWFLGRDPALIVWVGYPHPDDVRVWALSELPGRPLGCYCPATGPCHVEDLIRFVNLREEPVLTRPRENPAGLASDASTCIERLARATAQGQGGYWQPSDVHDVLRRLVGLVELLPQVFEQAHAWLTSEDDAGRVGDDRDPQVSGPAAPAIGSLQIAESRARTLAEALTAAKEQASHLSARRD